MASQDLPDVNVQVINREEHIRSATSSALASVRFYTLEKEDRYVLVYSQIPRPIDTSSYLLKFETADIGNMKPLMDIRVINSLDLSRADSEPQASILLQLPSDVTNLIYDEFYAFNDSRFERIHSWIVAARVLRSYCNILYNKPVTITINEPIVMDRVDLSQFKFRDLGKIAESIANPIERNDFKNALRNQFVETMNEGVPDYEVLYSANRYYGSERSNYATYKIPILNIEKHMIDCASKHFSQLYMHPVRLLEQYRGYETDITRISPDTYERAYAANRNIRVHNPIVYTVDVKEYYDSSTSIRELATLIDGMVVINMVFRNMSHELTSLQQALRVSTNISSGVDTLSANINSSGLSRIVDAIFRTNINPNLYLIDISDISMEMWRSPMALIALRTFTSFIPATAILAQQRRLMNNIAICSILHHKLRAELFTQLSNVIYGACGVRLPDTSTPTQWTNSELDLMQIVYYHGRWMLATQRFEVVYTLLRLYFNEVDPEPNNAMIELPGGGSVQMSLCSPYYIGASPLQYRRDMEYDNFRTVRKMKPNGTLLMNSVTDYMEMADPTILRRIISFATNFYASKTSIRTTGTGLTAEQLSTLLSFIEMSGIERVLTIPRLFNSMRATFSTSIAADGIIRNIPPLHKSYIRVDSRYMTTGFLMIDPDVELKPIISIHLYGGTHVAYTMQIFKTLYHEIQNKCGLIAGDHISQIQLIRITTSLMQIFFHSADFDPKVMFGYEDAGQWRRFLRSECVPVEQLPLLKHFLELIGRMEPLLRDEYLSENILPRFYLTGGCYSRMQNPFMAINSIPRSRLKVVYKIKDPVDYEKLTGTYVSDGTEYGTEFDKLWYDNIHTIDPAAQMADDDNQPMPMIPAIRVQMNVRVSTDIITEDGSFNISNNQSGSNILDFHNFMTSSVQDIRKAKMLTLKHTIIMNDIGAGNRPGPLPLARRRESMLSRLPKMCMMVPVEDVRIKKITPMDLLDRLNNSVTFRKDAYVLWNEYKVDVVRAYQPPR